MERSGSSQREAALEFPRFACPVCSVGLKSAAMDRIHCPRCGSGYNRSMVDNLCTVVGRIVPEAGEEAEAFKARAIQELTKWRLPADPATPLNQRLSSEAVRIVGTAGDKTGPAILVLVAASRWTRTLVYSVFNDLLKLTKFMEQGRVDSRFQFVGPQPLPEPLHYTFSGTKQGRFERMALVQTGLYDPTIVVRPARVKKLVDLGISLVKSCFKIPLTLKDAEEVKWIEELVLKELRMPHSPQQAMPRGAYTPVCSLMILALLVGQTLLSRSYIQGEWTEEPGHPFSLALSIGLKAGGTPTLANPIDKTIKLFRQGSASPLTGFTEGLVPEKKRS